VLNKEAFATNQFSDARQMSRKCFRVSSLDERDGRYELPSDRKQAPAPLSKIPKPESRQDELKRSTFIKYTK
jgi:hypothetical protein